jgi:hypothetical protein
VTVELFSPQLVQPYAPVKNSDVNANLLLIEAAFNSLSNFDNSSSSYAFGNSQRNVLIDLSATTPGSWLTCTLPQNPTIGDPAVRVSVSRSGYSSVAQAQSSVVVVTADGKNIMGIPTIASLDGLPFLTNAGDTLTMLFVGGTYGWVIAESLITSYVAPLGVLTVQSWDPNYVHCFHGLESLIDTSTITNTQIKLTGINKPGLWASFQVLPGSVPVSLVTSSGAQTFNGVTGAFTVSSPPPNVNYRFTCIAVNNFVVTT